MNGLGNRLDDDPAEALPTFVRTGRSPAVPDSVGRISLFAERPQLAAARPSWPLRGSFRMAHLGDGDESVLRRLVLAVTSDASHVTLARHAVKDAVLFAEDVTVSPRDVCGYFNVDLADLFDFTNRQETFHIIASIGTDASDVLTCEVEFPWIDPPRAEPLPPADASPEGESEEEDEDADDDDSWMVDENQET